MKHNPSELVVNQLKDCVFDFTLETMILPVSFERSFKILEERILVFQPDIVLSLGVARKRQVITPEAMAINYIETKTADNDGCLPEESEIIESYPDELLSSLPVEDMVKVCESVGVPAKVSFSAGSYVCNQVMYKTLSLSKVKNFQSGFIHLPPIHEMSVERSSMGVKAMLELIAKY